MSLASLIQTHGYWMVFLGTFLEGETILVLGGVAAHRGYLELSGVMLSAFTGSLLCDQVFFWLGRRHGSAVLARRPSWRGKVARVESLFQRYDTQFIIGFRFVYGLRTVTPFVIGMTSGVGTARFALLNAVGAAVWTVAVGGAGYALGNAAEAIAGRARRYEAAVFLVVAAIGVFVWGLHFARARRARRRLGP